MSSQRQYRVFEVLTQEHEELGDIAEKLRSGDHAADAPDRLVRHMQLHETAEAPAMEAARKILSDAQVSEFEERWRTLRQLALDLQTLAGPPLELVDQFLSLLYDHTVDASARVYPQLYLQLDEHDYSVLVARIDNAIGKR